jgi:hypothetical protein
MTRYIGGALMLLGLVVVGLQMNALNHAAPPNPMPIGYIFGAILLLSGLLISTIRVVLPSR